MTNSTPKLNNKVEQQASPNVVGAERHQRHCHRYHRSSKSSPFFHSGGRHVRTNSGGRLSCSPQHSPSKSTRNSPLRGECSPRNGSPTNNSFYAGAKFSEPPSPASLPKPPSHWVTRLMNGCHQSVQDISRHLTMVLQIQA
ncbi:PREDICTED: proline-rich nuclear receptor coactivator 2-like [Dinoponera quadriceps]|uniref:Proline-rich nuclear receptor coactivator 2-like n=1 Tax=Dinoponera quadriceps TaxID=609295 RepID=A0A6P3Y7A4_DINQU|nr:PREDICTED: proline-rich nuclear receptor coactivator 2-like [Dinoponera quadriceps]